MVTPQIRHRQNICGCIFIVLYALNFVVQVWSRHSSLATTFPWYPLVLGVFSVAGFVYLYRLSSNMAADFFSATQVGLEIFFSFVLPFLFSYIVSHSSEYVGILYICILFCVIAVFIWSMLLSNVKFPLIQNLYLSFLPIPYLVNIWYYWSLLQMFSGNNSPIYNWISNDIVLSIENYVMIPLTAIGYWVLSHSVAFSADKDVRHFPSFSPFNKYFLLYLLLGLVVIFILS